MGATDLILEDTMTYLRYFLSASPFLVFSFTLSTFARNDNAPQLAMWALIIGSTSNIVLDWVFMYPLNMGIAGAALATALGPIFSVLILLPHFLLKKGVLTFEVISLKIRDVKTILTKGMAAFITNFSIGLVTLLFNMAISYNKMGEVYLSSYIIIGYISLIALTCFLGSSQGIQPAISYFSGSGEEHRIKKLTRNTIYFNIILAIILTVSIWIFGENIVATFTNDQSLIHLTKNISNIYFINLVFAAVNIVIATVLQALNQQKASTYLSLMRSTLPLMILLVGIPYVFGIENIWHAVTGTEIITIIFSLYIWFKFSKSII